MGRHGGTARGAVIADIPVGSEFRWTAEELRVSLFAQHLGTSVKTSPQRCEKLLTGK
jgi:ATP-dependent helicase HrpA